MRLKWLGLIFLMAVFFLLQTVWGGGLATFAGKINLLAVLLVILLNLVGFGEVMLLLLPLSLIFDLYSSLPFGTLTLAFFVSALVAGVLFYNFFTNFSFYSLLLLGLVTQLVYGLMLTALVMVFYFVGLIDIFPGREFLFNNFWQLLSTELLLVAAYFLINAFSRRFKPLFLN